MRRSLLWGSVLCLFLTAPSCKSRYEKAGVLPPDSMRVILWQMMEADAAVNGMNFHSQGLGDRDRVYAELYTRIFRAHHVNREAFMRSYKFYMTDPVLLKTVIDSMSHIERVQRSRPSYPAFTHGPPPGRNPRPGQNIGHPAYPGGHPPTFSPGTVPVHRPPPPPKRSVPPPKKDSTTRRL